MRIPAVRGVIDRRILANFRIDPEVMQRALPRPFRPQLVGGYAIGGICLIRLKHIRPRFIPFSWGIGSENAAHRIAVQWDADGETRQGVYIPRRDTNSRLNALAGGTFFPGIHHHAAFTVKESERYYFAEMRSDDGDAHVLVSGNVSTRLPISSVFRSVQDASDFFQQGSLGYSDTQSSGRFDGLELRCRAWQVQPLDVEEIQSSYFMDPSQFPEGSVEFDCALLMRDVQHEWHGREDLCCELSVAM